MEEYYMPLRSDMQELVRHGSAEFPIQYYANELHRLPGRRIPLHWHPQPEFFYVYSGSAVVHAGNNELVLNTGEAVFLNGNALHSYSQYTGDGDPDMHCVCPDIVFSDELIAPLGSSINKQYVTPIMLNDRLPFVKLSPDTAWQKEILELLRKVFSLLQSYGKAGHLRDFKQLDYGITPDSGGCFEMEVQRLMSRIWQLLYQNRGQAELEPLVRSEHALQIRMQKMLSYIHENYSQNITLHDIAHAASISKSEASRCFQSYLHTSPVNYLLDYRIERARQLLRNSSMTVETVSIECGFSTSAYFCKIFRTRTGVTPKQYRSGSTE
ncbi:MAG: helix-turn-helix domain-containing protein [Oscillospiraceae bacterium]